MSLAEDLNTGGVIAGIESRFAEEDGRRLDLLDWFEAHGWGSTPSDRIPPEVVEQARRELGHPQAQTTPTARSAPAEREETTMPCKSCGKEGHNARTCSGEPKKAAEKAPAKAKAPPTAPAPKPARGPRIEIRVETIDELLDRRAQLLGELDQVDARIRAALVAKEDELAKLRAAVEAAKQRAESQAEAA